MTQEEYAATCRHHRPWLIEQVTLFAVERDDAEDLTDHAVSKILSLCGRLTRENFRNYMRLVVRRIALDFLELRRHQVEVPLFVGEDGSPLIDVVVYANEDVRIDITRALYALPLALRTVALQLYAAEWTQREIAAQRQCSQMSVSRMVTEINTHLRQSLAVYAQGKMS